MKKLVIFLVCSILMILSTKSNCQELINYHSIQNHPLGIKNRIQSSSKEVLWSNSKYLISKPGYIKYYEWDNHWQYLHNSTLTYNEKGVLIEKEINIMVPGDTKYKFFWIYDNYDNLIEYTVHHWINKNWEVYLSQKIFITYDESGNILEMMSQIFEEDVWINFWETEYELGNQGEWIEYTEYIWENEMWVNDLKHLDIVWYSWINFQLESYVVQTWDSGWVNTDKFSMTYNENIYSGIWEKYDDESWILYERETYTFNEFEEVDLYELHDGEIWVNSEKYSFIHDELGSITRYTFEFWEEENWSIDTDVKFLLTYNSNNDLTEEIVQLWDKTYNLWYDIQKFVNYDFQYFEMGLEEIIIRTHLDIYPNPATSILTVDFSEGGNGAEMIQIFTVNGQKVYDEKLIGSQNKIDVSTFPKGLYIIQLFTNDRIVINQKFLKQ